MTPESIREIFGYNYWAWELAWKHIARLTDEQFVEDVGYSQSSVRHQIVHVMSATQRWIDRFERREARPHLQFEDYPTCEVTKNKWETLKADTLVYINAIDQARLNQVIEWELPARKIKAAQPLWELLLHVGNHSADHRVQILATLHFKFGIQTPEQDMLFYLLEAEKQKR
jgi:uncharacterized damage-inducible protein DinB